MTGLRIGVLGGAGFIGRRLVARLLDHGHVVSVGDIKPRVTDVPGYRPCDVRDLAAVRSFARGLDVVYSLAAEHRDDVRPIERYAAVNVEGARHICIAAAEANVARLIFTSTVAVYGIPSGPASEDAPCRPFNEYGRTKLEAERVYRAWASEDPKRALVIVRPTVVFGEGNRGNVYNLARQIANGRFLMVGDGRNRKSMAYVENVVGFLLHLLSSPPGVEVFNYADAPDLTMNELVGLMRRSLGKTPSLGVRVPYALGVALGHALDGVARVTGRQLPISAIRVRKFCANTQIRAERALGAGYSPAFSLKSAVERFFAAEFGSNPDEKGAVPRSGDANDATNTSFGEG